MSLKIAIIHDWLVTNAGAEKALKAIIELYSDADIFCLVDFLDQAQRDEILQGKSTTTTFIQKLPFSKNKFRNYLPLFPKAIESLDLSKYNLILSSSWAVAKGIQKREDQLHICYCHTPIRYAWDLYDQYTLQLKQPKKVLVQQSLKYIRSWDIQSLNRVDYFISNSYFVKTRINRIYKKDAKVIYPPIDINKFTLEEQKENYYLSASRLVSYKKTKLIVEAFNKMPDKILVIIGDGEEYTTIKQIAKSNIKVLGYQNDEILIKYMQKAKAFVYAAIEDFGIIPLEANSCGTPVIALDQGGTKETIKDGVNGIHFSNQEKDDIIKAINRFESLKFNPKDVRDTVKKYTFFKQEFKKFIDQKVEDFK